MSDTAQSILETVRRVIGERDGFVPLHEPEFSGNESAYVADCIETGWVSSVGAYVDRFEQDLAAFTGVGHAVATVNGTAALHVALLLAGVKPGDEVLMPTLTFIATANATSYAGAKPHFIDSEAQTLAVDPVALERHLAATCEIRDGSCQNRETGARIAALIVMHAFGHPAQLDELVALSERWRIPLVEDAAESLGSSYKGKHTGQFGTIAALSFNGNKVMTTGGGGAILTNDPALAKRAKHLTTTARVPHRWNFVHDEIGFNYRLPNLNAALGCAQLERVPEMLARKRLLARRYETAFAPLQGVRFVTEPKSSSSNYWLCTLLLDRRDARLHEEVLETLNDADLMARPVWTLIHRLAMFAHCPRADLACAEDLAARIVNIPSSPNLVGPPGGVR
ncbi:LegC family aminotransferase [Erythrobacter citreus]|uniref:GDP-perosamine synthase n=1 Tax=Qipengyuania citrea TaxID=225971 RepID=A0A6I4UDA9_9SPHN|nr:LegC family aminotransferase [Qipengyuania citrea]MDQ0567358.1 perosamine synthetase [Qipengyuania citrea]MXP36902.1 LegC family aminotransferase [Qipengyuania citrea]